MKYLTIFIPLFFAFVPCVFTQSNTNLQIVSFTISDENKRSTQYSNEDILTITFNLDTNQPLGPKLTKEQIDTIFIFTRPIGENYEAAWTTPKIIKIKVLDTTGNRISLQNTRVLTQKAGKLSTADNPNVQEGVELESPTLTGNFGSFSTALDSIKITPTLVKPPTDRYITFRDMPKDTLVRIYDIASRLLFQAQNNDSSAVWDLKTNNNQDIGSGVYLAVFILPSGDSKTLKFIVVR